MDAQALADGRRPVASSWGNEIAVLAGAHPTYAALVRAIDAAQERAWLSIYALRPDPVSEPILAALERAARRGLDVRLVVDGFGSRGLEPRLEALRAAGVSALRHPIVGRVGRLRRPDARNHKKIAVFDSRRAFVGGVNVGAEFVGWRDLHLEIAGPAARDLEAVVLADHRDAGGSPAELAPLPASAGARGPGRIDVVSSAVPNAMKDALLGVIGTAIERVVVTTPYFVPDRAMRAALAGAARRGVRVEVLTPRRSNWPMANWAGRSSYPQLLEAGVRIAEHHEAMLHAKAVVVDGRVAAIGSPNFDARSFHINGEVLCLVFCPAAVAAIERSIADDRAEAREVARLDFGRRSRWDRTVEATAALFSRWL